MNRLTHGAGWASNVVILSETETDEVISRLSPTDIAQLEMLPGISRLNGRPLASRETCVLAQQTFAESAAHEQKRRFVSVRGIDSPGIAAHVRGVSIQTGGYWFSEAGVQELPRPLSVLPIRFDGKNTACAPGKGDCRVCGEDEEDFGTTFDEIPLRARSTH